MRKITRKQAVLNMQCLFDDFFKTYFNAPKEAIEETIENATFGGQKERLRKAVYSTEYSSILGQLDSESFRKYYEKVGEFAKAYKIDMRLFTEETPALIEDINDVLGESPNIAEKLDLINGFTDEELRTERISFDTKTALMEDLLDSWFVGDDKEQGINRLLMSLTAEDRLAFVNKIGTDRKFLNRLIQCVNGREKDEMLAVLGEIFIGTGLANEGTGTAIDNGQSDKIEASYNNGSVSITVLQEQGMGARDYRMTPKARYTVNALENISMYYDGRLINVPALLLLNSWSNSMAEPEGLFYNCRNEDIDWNTLSDEKKDEYFYKFVAHYLPSGFVEAFGNPIQIIIMSCITILTGGLFAELQAALAAAGIVMTAIDAKNAIGGLIQANNQKEATRTMHEAKNAAKVMARCIAKLTLDVINVLCTVAGYLKGKKKIVNKETEKVSNTISRNAPIVKQIESETSSEILNELAARNNIEKEMSAKIKEVGWTKKEFAEKAVTEISKLSDDDLLKIKQINDTIPKPTNDTLMSKVITEKTYLNYITNGEYSDTIGNCLAKAEDLFDCKTYMDYYNKLGLNYFIDGKPGPYTTAEKMYIVRFTSGETESKVVRNLGGTNDIEVSRIKNLYKDCSDISFFKQDDPFVGNGFTKTTSGELGKPEYNTIDYCRIKNGAAIYKLGRNGLEELVAVRIDDIWIPLGDEK